jgi:hypothetical protein
MRKTIARSRMELLRFGGIGHNGSCLGPLGITGYSYIRFHFIQRWNGCQSAREYGAPVVSVSMTKSEKEAILLNLI